MLILIHFLPLRVISRDMRFIKVNFTYIFPKISVSEHSLQGNLITLLTQFHAAADRSFAQHDHGSRSFEQQGGDD